MNKYADIYNANGIAAIFAENFANDFADFFAENTAAGVDGFILYKYGNRYLCDTITATNAAAVVVSIIAHNLQTWKKVYALLNVQYDATKSRNETHTKTGTLQRSENSTNTAVNAEKAFNDTEFVTDTQNTDTRAATNTDTYNLTETTTAQNGNVSEIVQKEIYLRERNNLQTLIINKIISEICLDVLTDVEKYETDEININ